MKKLALLFSITLAILSLLIMGSCKTTDEAIAEHRYFRRRGLRPGPGDMQQPRTGVIVRTDSR